jgi:hypothetical protein
MPLNLLQSPAFVPAFLLFLLITWLIGSMALVVRAERAARRSRPTPPHAPNRVAPPVYAPSETHATGPLQR